MRYSFCDIEQCLDPWKSSAEWARRYGPIIRIFASQIYFGQAYSPPIVRKEFGGQVDELRSSTLEV